MDQALDLHVAAMIFLSGTRCLATGDFTGDVERMSEIDEESEDKDPHPNLHSIYGGELNQPVIPLGFNMVTNQFILP